MSHPNSLFSPLQTTQIDIYSHWIGGQKWEPCPVKYVDKVNPLSGEVDAMFPLARREEIFEAIKAITRSKFAYQSFQEKKDCLIRLYDEIKNQADKWKYTLFQDLGQSYFHTEVEFQLTCAVLEEYLQIMDEHENIRKEKKRFPYLVYPSLFNYHPKIMGLILSWHYPFFNLTRWVLPGWILGYAIIIRASTLAFRTILESVKTFSESFQLPMICQVLLGDDESALRLAEREELSYLVFFGDQQEAPNLLTSAGKHFTHTYHVSIRNYNGLVLFPESLHYLDTLFTWLEYDFSSYGVSSPFSFPFLFVHHSIQGKITSQLTEWFSKLSFNHTFSYNQRGIAPLPSRYFLEECEYKIKLAQKEGASLFYGGIPYSPFPNCRAFYFMPTLLGYSPLNRFHPDWFIPGPVLHIFPFQNINEIFEFYHQLPKIPRSLHLLFPEKVLIDPIDHPLPFIKLEVIDQSWIEQNRFLPFWDQKAIFREGWHHINKK